MSIEVIFTKEEISDFCRITGDTNRIHDAEVMRREHGKLAIVPGMLTLSRAAGYIVVEYLRKGANVIEVYFGSPLHADEAVTITPTPNPEDPLEVRLSAHRQSEDLLYARGHPSRIYKVEGIRDSTFEGNPITFPLNPDDIKRFAELIGAEEPVAAFLLSVAYSSRALLENARGLSGQNVGERKGVLPVYQLLEIFVPNGIPSVNPVGNLDFKVRSEPVGRREHLAYIECRQGETVVYTAKYHIVETPEKVITQRIARDCPKVPQP